jgi:hypothetical protein
MMLDRKWMCSGWESDLEQDRCRTATDTLPNDACAQLCHCSRTTLQHAVAVRTLQSTETFMSDGNVLDEYRGIRKEVHCNIAYESLRESSWHPVRAAVTPFYQQVQNAVCHVIFGHERHQDTNYL